jgi:ATP-dependent helicase/nuclease subunit B
MRTIEGHHDFGVLEDRLAALIRQAQQGDASLPFPPVAVVAPTRLLLSHLQVTLADKLPVLANVHFFHHQSLAGAAGAAMGSPAPRPLGDDVKAKILAGLIEARGGSLADYVLRRPGSVASILSTLDDLREAGVPADAAAKIKGLTGRGRDLLQIDAAYSSRLDAPGAPLQDRARWLSASAPAVRDYCRRFRLVVHYGAYDLIGVNLDLVRAVEASGTRLVFLAPYHPSSRGYDLARRFWPEMLGQEPAVLPDASSDRLLASRLPFLYQEGAGPAPLDFGRPPRVRLFHAQGAAAELREVALDVLALRCEQNIPLHRVGVIARSLEPYAAWLRPIFEEHGLPFATSATLGALREARVQGALQLARAVLRDFPRQPLMDLFRSGLLRLKGKDVSRQAHVWDRLSRSWHVTGGYDTWTGDLPRWLAEWEPYVPPDAIGDERARARVHKEGLVKDVASLASAVKSLHGTARPLMSAASWSAWADAMEALLRDRLYGFEPAPGGENLDPGAGAVLGLLPEMRRLDAAGVPFTRAAALAFFEQALARAALPIGSSGGPGGRRGADNGGVRVLDAMQARGLAFDAVYLIGFNADLFPRRAAEDSFLPDGDRRLLRGRLGVPVPIKMAAHEEERLLLAHLLGSARLRLTVSWQRADDSGRARVASLALREVARLVYGEPVLKRLVDAARRVKAHPAEAGEDALERFHMLPPLEACVNAALQARSPRRLLEAAGDLPFPSPESADSLRAGLGMMGAIEEWQGADAASLRYDAFVGKAAPPPARFSPSRLEILGACPQHYFFRHVLGVQELEEAREGYEFDVREVGGRVHSVLHDVYRELSGPDGSLPEDGPSGLLRRALDLARRAWDRHTRDIAARTRPRYPLLWETTERLWMNALAGFLGRDLAALQGQRARLAGLERQENARLTLGAGGRSIEVLGRFDRIVAGPDGLVVGDYKTSGDIGRHVSPAQMLKGLSLQMPLYLLLAEALKQAGKLEAAPVRAEVLGVGPAFTGDPAAGGDEARASLDMATLGRHREAFAETLGVLLDLAAGGSFPLNDRSWLCGHCPYVRACRRWHVPTLRRLASAPSGSDYALLRSKNTRLPTLEMVRQRGGNGEEA